jgi:Ca2+-binding EF-hand superfamily protein
MEQEKAKTYILKQEELKKKNPSPSIQLPPPTTPWFPDPRAPVLGKPLTPNIPTSLNSPRSQARIARRRDILASIQARFNGATPPNIQQFMTAAAAEMDERGYLTAVQLTKVFRDIGVGDVSVIDSFYKLLDARRRGFVPLLHLLVAVDTILNGMEKQIARQACFEPFNLDQRGYIHKSHLDELKAAKDPLERDATKTPQMVKVLNDVFRRLEVVEEERYLASLSKGKGKKKKPPPLRPNQKSIIPTNMMRLSHMNFKTFDQYFDVMLELSTAFSQCWLQALEKSPALKMSVIRALEDLGNEGIDPPQSSLPP